MGYVCGAVCLLSVTLAAQSLPWVFPSDIRERMRISDLVISGMVEGTWEIGLQTLDRTKLTRHIANVQVDRIFQGKLCQQDVEFTWFTQYFSRDGGIIYSGPPLASFRSGQRYLIFLNQTAAGWQVAMPVYELEVRLASQLPAGALPDLSGEPLNTRYRDLAEELETAALLVPPPPRGVTGEAATYFPVVFDLVGGCAEPFYRKFLLSPGHELRAAALNWLSLIRTRGLTCEAMLLPKVRPFRLQFP